MSANRSESEIVRELGETFGFGRLMQLAESEWREFARKRGLEGSEHTTGPCAAFMVPCQCAEETKPALDPNGHCNWCCGGQRVTKHVRATQKALDAWYWHKLAATARENEIADAQEAFDSLAKLVKAARK